MLHSLLLAGLLTAAAPPVSPPAFEISPSRWLRFADDDSVGVTVRGGKTFIKYQIRKGDTFYSIARQYGLPMGQVVAANPKVESGLRIGQVVLVPRATAVLTAEPPKPGAAVSKPVVAPKSGNDAEAPPVGGSVPQTHLVKSGESLSTIARKYHTSIAKLRELNHLKTDALHLKQKLVVGVVPAGARGAEARAAAHSGRSGKPSPEIHAAATPPPVATPVAADPPPDTPPVGATEPRATTGAAAATDTSAGTEVAESLRKVTESGTAEAIDQSSESNKYLALHRTAPVGTILQVKNPQNGQSVYVRVIGKLPPTGANENVIIRLSKRAVQKLAAVDARFRVEVSYMP